MPWPIAIASLMLIGGLALTVAGLIGRRVSNHPHCRRCRFDLSGLPGDAEASGGSARCPECGQDLATAGAIRIGLRRKRAGPLLGGLVTLVLLAALAGGAFWLTTRGPKVYAKLPTNTLLWLAPYLDSNQLGIAAKELKARATQGMLSSSQWQTLANATLARQLDLARPWSPALGEVFEIGFEKQSISKAQFDEYLQHAVRMALRCRPEVGPGDPLPMKVEVDVRLGCTGHVRVRAKLVDVLVGGARIDGERYGFEITPDSGPFSAYAPDMEIRPTVDTFPEFGNGPPGVKRPPFSEARVPATPGPATVETVWAVFVGEAPHTRSSGMSTTRLNASAKAGPRRETDREVLDHFREETASDTWFLPSHPWLSSVWAKKAGPDGHVALQKAACRVTITERTPEPGWIRDPAVSASLAAGTTAQRWTSITQAAAPQTTLTFDSLSISIPGGAALAGKLYEIVGDTEELVGALAIDAAPPLTVGGVVRVPSVNLPLELSRGLQATRSFVLRPDADAAKLLINQDRVQGEPIWFVDVPATGTGSTWTPPTAGRAAPERGPGAHGGAKMTTPCTGQGVVGRLQRQLGSFAATRVAAVRHSFEEADENAFTILVSGRPEGRV